MALNAYLTVKGQKQGQIKGSVTQKGREGWMAIYATRHEIVSPRDPASGLPTGKRQHKQFTVTKETDMSTPMLYQAMVTNENLPEIILRFFAPTAVGSKAASTEVQNYTIKFTNANISDIIQEMQLNKTDPGAKLPVLEMISFTYQKIEWTWNDGNIIASDSWAVAAP